MKVVNIPSTKVMKKFLRICARSSLHRPVPIHAIVLNFSRHCERSEAIHRGITDGWMDGIASLRSQ
jgi:hypothetical protein